EPPDAGDAWSAENAPSVADNRANPDTPAVAPGIPPAIAPAEIPPPERPSSPSPCPPPPAANATGGFNVTDGLTVSGEPLPNRRLSWPLACATARVASGACACLATSSALVDRVSTAASSAVSGSALVFLASAALSKT